MTQRRTATASNTRTGTDEAPNDRFWRGQAEQLIAAMLWTAANTENHSMRNVVRWVLELDRPVGDSGGTLAPLLRLLTDHPEPSVALAAKQVQGWLHGQWSTDPRTTSSVYATARNAVWPWADPDIAATAEECDVTLDWLLEGPNTLYLCAPLGDETRIGVVFAVMLHDLITQAFDRYTRTGEPLEPRLLVLLDEAANTPLPKLPQWASTVTGAGTQLVTVWQSKAQLDQTYRQDADTGLTNHRSKVIYPSGLSDLSTVQYISELVGDKHVRSDLDERGGWRTGPDEPRTGRSPATALPFLPASTLRQVEVGDALLVHGHRPPAWIRGRRFRGGVERVERSAGVPARHAAARYVHRRSHREREQEVEPHPDEDAEQLEDLESEAEGAVAEVAPEVQDYGLHDERWSTDEWRALLDELIALGLVTWKEIVVLALGQMNPPQVGTAVASSKGFQDNFDRTAGGSLMSAVMRWFYAEAGTCADCGTRLDLQADHVDARQNYENPGDADRLDNLTLRCRRCNVVRRPSHVFGGVTHLSAESALMWILLVIRPRTLLDFVRLCRLYAMTMADVRMQEAWAMAQWLSRDDRVAYEIEDPTGTYDIELWPDGSVTRRRTGSDTPHGEPHVLYSGVPGDAVFAFVSRDDAGACRFHEVPISVLPFSTYDLGDRPASALAVLPTPPDRTTGVMAPLRFLPPRGLELVSFTVRSPTQISRVEYLDSRGQHRTSDGPTSPRGRALSPAPQNAISVITI